MTNGIGRRLARLEAVWRRPCPTCRTWPAILCFATPEEADAAEAAADRGRPRGICPACGACRPVIIGVDCDAI